MKKLLSLLLCLALALCLTGATAETVRFVEDSSTFDIEMELPEGAAVRSSTGGTGVSVMRIGKEGLATVSVNIAVSDLLGEDSLNDMGEEDVQLLVQAAGEQYDAPSSSVDITPSGNKYIYTCSNGESDMDSIVTVYDGYFIEMTQWYDDYHELTEADHAFLLQLLYNLEFLPIE